MKKNILLISVIAVVIISIIVVWILVPKGQKKDEEPSIFDLDQLVQSTTMLGAPSQSDIEAAKKAGKRTAVITTSKGEITVELRGDLMPLTVANFVQLVNADFYNGLTFHRVEDWVVQGGDPSGDGTGGPGYTIKLETNKELSNVRGALAMARSQDPNSAGSQFYFIKKDMTSLDGEYAVFGTVIQGMEVVDKIKIGDKINKIVIQ